MKEQDLAIVYETLSKDQEVQLYSQMLRGQQKFNLLAKIEAVFKNKKQPIAKGKIQQEEVEEPEEVDVEEEVEQGDLEEPEEAIPEEIPTLVPPKKKPKPVQKQVKKKVEEPEEDLDLEDDDFP